MAWGELQKPLGLPKRRQLRRHFFYNEAMVKRPFYWEYT